MLNNIWRSKGNQTMQICQLIEYDKGNILVEKTSTICGGEATPRPFYKKIKTEHISGSSVWNVAQIFYCISKSRSTKIY